MLRNVLRLLSILTASSAVCLHAQAPPIHADRILVVKSTHTMTLYAGGKELKR